MINHTLSLVLTGAMITFQQAAAFIVIHDIPTKKELAAEKKRKRALAPYKRNLSIQYGRPTSVLQVIPCLGRLLTDENRAYIHKVTHLHQWQFMMLADKLKALIERPRRHEHGLPRQHFRNHASLIFGIVFSFV